MEPVAPRHLYRPRIFYGWWVAFAYVVLNFYWGGTLMVGFTALFTPIRESFNLSNTVTTLAISLRYVISILAAPIVGIIFDRIGSRGLMIFGTFCSAGGLLLLAASQSTWVFFMAFAITSVGFAIWLVGTGPALMMLWFKRHRGKATGIILAAGLAGSFLVPVVVWLEGEWGWRTTIVIIAIGLVAFSMPVNLLIRHRPDKYGMLPDGDTPQIGLETSETVSLPEERPSLGVREALNSRAFWFLTISQTIPALGASSAMLFIIPHLEEQGIARSTAGFSVTALGIVGLMSTLVLGWLADYADRRYIIATAFLLEAGGLCVLAFATSPWHLVPFAVLYGAGAGASFPAVSALQADYFGVANFGKIQGAWFSIYTTASAVGPIIGGAIRDVTGSYTSVFVIYAVAILAAIAAIIAIRRPTQTATSGEPIVVT